VAPELLIELVVWVEWRELKAITEVRSTHVFHGTERHDEAPFLSSRWKPTALQLVLPRGASWEVLDPLPLEGSDSERDPPS
jgi:hypothetical protein